MANALNPNIILQGQGLDVIGSMDAGAIAGQRARTFQNQNALNGYLQQNGAQVMGGDQNALNGLSSFGLEGLNAAQGVQSNRLGMEQTRLGMDATRQNMQLAQSQEARLTRAEERAIQEHAATLSAEQRAQEAAQIEQAVAQGLATTSPQQWDAVVGQIAPDLVGQFDNREVIAGRYMSIADVLKRTDERNAPQSTNYIAAGDAAVALGLPAEGAFNVESGPGGMKATAIGGGGTVVNNNMGADAGAYLYGTDAGVPAGWRVDRATGVASPIPGGPVAFENAQVNAQGANKDRQGDLKLGTTLQSLNLNISEIENGGLPVAGVAGDFRRSTVGRVLTGDGAVDFGNRTDQITTSAALAEVQNMRDNSKTGGAVGQLTDDERRALGNSITALNNSTSEPEYMRAAKAYRKLALDLAYGAGAWKLEAGGGISLVDAPATDPRYQLPQADQDLLDKYLNGGN